MIPEKRFIWSWFLNIPLKSIEIELKLIDLLVFGYIAEISGPFKIKQTLVKKKHPKLGRLAEFFIIPNP